MKGRPRKPIEVLKLSGAYRPDMHGDRSERPEAAGVPERPADMSIDAAWLWDFVTAELTANGTIKRVDTAHLWLACEMWGFYREAAELAKIDPTDKDVRIAVLGYAGAFEAAAARCGLTPVDRERLHCGKGPAAKPAVAKRTRA